MGCTKTEKSMHATKWLLQLTALAVFFFGAAARPPAQTLNINEHRFIAPISIPINTTGVDDIAMVRLKLREDDTSLTISSIRLVPSSTAGFNTAWVDGIRVYLEPKGAPSDGEYDHGSTAEPLDKRDVLVSSTYTWDAGGWYDIAVNATLYGGGGGWNYLYVVLDFTASAPTNTNIGCSVSQVTHSGTGSPQTPPAIVAANGARLNFDDYTVTATATGQAQPPGDPKAPANDTNVEVFLLNLSLADASATAYLKSVKVHRLGGADNWVSNNGVLLYVNDGDTTFEPGGADGAAVATATLGAISTGYATLTLASSVAVPAAGQSFWVAVNLNSEFAAPGQTFGLEVEIPSTDITFADEIQDDNDLLTAEYAYVQGDDSGLYEYNQTAFIDPASTTAIPNSGNIFTVEPANDGVPPEVAGTLPITGATNVDRDGNITVVFDKYMAESGAGSVTNTANYVLFETLTPANTVNLGLSYVPGTQTLTADPVTALAWGKQYTFTVKSTVADYYNVAMGTDYSWSFTVEPARYPIVTLTVPDSGATNVVRDTQITATFSENVTGVGGSSFKLYEGSIAPANEVTTVIVAYDNVNWVATMTLNPPPPTTKLKFNTQYWATLNHDLITDSDGLKLADQILGGTEQDKVWSFWTVAATPPSVLSVTPAEDATSVPIASTIQVVFSKPIDATTLAGNITVLQGSSPVSGNISPSTGYTNTATFTPASALDYLKIYTVTVATGIKDTDNTALSAPKTWSFTTFGFTKATIVNNRLVPGVNSETLIFVPQAGASDRVSVQVFTTTGRLVRTFYKNVAFGSVAVPIRWDGTNDRGKPLGPGLYFVQIVVAGTKQVLKVLIVR